MKNYRLMALAALLSLSTFRSSSAVSFSTSLRKRSVASDYAPQGQKNIQLSTCVAQDKPVPTPSADQIALQEMEMYAFIHYSLNTYTDQEWGYGNEELSLFTPC